MGKKQLNYKEEPPEFKAQLYIFIFILRLLLIFSSHQISNLSYFKKGKGPFSAT